MRACSENEVGLDEGAKIVEVQASRQINSKVSGRGKIGECWQRDLLS